MSTPEVSQAPLIEVAERSSLLVTPSEQPFEHLGRLALRVLSVPLAVVAILDGQRTFSSWHSAHEPPELDEEAAAARDVLCQQVASSGCVLVVGDVAADLRTRDNAWLRALGVRAVVASPLMDSDGAVLGALWVADVVRRSWVDEDLELLDALAETAASKAMLSGAVRRADETARLLQVSMLTDLPELAHILLVARYLPAQETAQIGGDWYDAFVLPDGVAALAIGDVAGHDLPAAARMGQLRNLLRGIAWHANPAPHELLSGLDSVAYGLAVAELATAVYARLEPTGSGGWMLRWANAGHPPPLLCLADGSARYLDQPSGVLLGLGDGVHTDGLVGLPALSTLLLYTDGLIESRHLDIDVGLDRLRQTAQAAAGWPLEQFCDHVLGELAFLASEDDVTLLAIRVPSVDAEGDQRRA